MIVADTNVICYRWMASPHSDAVDAAWRRDADWIAPLLWRSEFRNALAGALRSGLINLDGALQILADAESQLAGREFTVASHLVMKLVGRSNCSAYDCEFVALAQEQGVRLLTVDRQVLRDFPNTAISLEQFTL